MKSIADLWFGPFRDGDIEALERALADDFVHESPFGKVEGKEAYLELVRANAEAFFQCVIEIADVIGDEQRAAVRYVVDGMRACDCVYVEAGRITKVHAYYHHGKNPSFDRP